MGVIINPESELGKELQKWEQFDRHGMDGTVHKAGNPYTYRPYPKMLYKAHPFRTGKTLTSAPPVSPFGHSDPNMYNQALLEADAFNRSCQRIVADESQHAIAKGQGWCESQAEAMEQHERTQNAIAKEAAEAAFQAQKMSDSARAEFDGAVDASEGHVSDVAAPKRQGPRTTVAVK
jgi:hypothetical protein